MNSKIIVLIVGALVAVGLVLYLTGGDTSKTQTAETESTPGEMTENDNEQSFQEEGFGSLATLFGLGRDLTCTFSHTDTETGAVNSGDFYYDGGTERFRIDSTSRVDGSVYVTHMINNNEMMYLWTEGPEGIFAMRMNPEEYESNQGVVAAEGQTEAQPFSVDEEVEYDCATWNVNASLFEPPSEIEFLDMEAMMQGMMQNMPGGFELPEGFDRQ